MIYPETVRPRQHICWRKERLWKYAALRTIGNSQRIPRRDDNGQQGSKHRDRNTAAGDAPNARSSPSRWRFN